MHNCSKYYNNLWIPPESQIGTFKEKKIYASCTIVNDISLCKSLSHSCWLRETFNKKASLLLKSIYLSPYGPHSEAVAPSDVKATSGPAALLQGHRAGDREQHFY